MIYLYTVSPHIETLYVYPYTVSPHIETLYLYPKQCVEPIFNFKVFPIIVHVFSPAKAVIF